MAVLRRVVACVAFSVIAVGLSAVGANAQQRAAGCPGTGFSNWGCECNAAACSCLGGTVSGGRCSIPDTSTGVPCLRREQCIVDYLVCAQQRRFDAATMNVSATCLSHYTSVRLNMLTHAITLATTSPFTTSCTATLCKIFPTSNVTCSDRGTPASDAGDIATCASAGSRAPAVCDCKGRGTSYSAPWRENRCYCSCRWPFRGATCSECARATDYFDNATATCRSCTLNTARRDMVSESGATRTYSMTLASQCLAGRQGLYYSIAAGGRWTSVFAPLTTSGFSVAASCDAMRDNRWAYFPFQLPMYLRSTAGGYTWLGQLNCAPTMRIPTELPRRVHLHLLDPSAESVAVLVSLVGAFQANGTAITWTDFRSAALHNTTRASTVATDLNMWVHRTAAPADCRLFRDGNTGFAQAVASSEATNVLLIGNTGASCNDLLSELVAIVRTGARIAWVSQSAPALRFVSPISYTRRTVFEIETQLAALFAASGAGDTCAPTITVPASVEMYSRSLVSVSGACNISSCCLGSDNAQRCSRFVSTSGAPGCMPPVISRMSVNQRVAFSATTAGGVRQGNTLASRNNVWSKGIYAWRQQSFQWRRVDGFFQARSTLGDTVRVYRWSTSGASCCQLVGMSFEDKVAMNLTAPQCFPTGSRYYASLTFTVPTMNDANLLGRNEHVAAVAVQCGTEVLRDDPSLSDGTSTPIGATVAGTVAATVDPLASPVTTAAAGSITAGRRQVGVTTGATVTMSTVNRQRVDRYVASILRRVEGGSTSAMKNVRLALADAGLMSTITPARRVCGTEDVPNRAGNCEFAWSRTAAEAGPYLVSAGLTEMDADFTMTGLERGDIVVVPAVTLTVGGTATSYDSGAIFMVVDPTAANPFVGGVAHGTDVIPGLQAAVAAGATLEGSVKKYRLSGIVEEHPMGPAEALYPVAGVKEVTADRAAYCAAWNRRDRTTRNTADSLAHLENRYRCPAVLDFWTRPRQFGSGWLYDLGIAFNTQCFDVNSWWIRGTTAATAGTGLRCCYDSANRYIPTWPSRMTITDRESYQWAWTDEVEAERTCCAGRSTSSRECLAYRDRRPAVRPTNAPFNAPQWWWPRRRRAGGWGDPHCATYDGVSFECNFHGEATWTACGNWTVNAVAEPVGTGSATAITKFAVRYNETTVIGRLVNASTSADNRGYEVLINGEAVTDDTDADQLSVTFSNDTVTITDEAGNDVEATFAASLITISTLPAESCRGATTGLCGNFNGNETDDLAVPGSNTILSVNASSDVIFRDFVVPHLVTAQSSLFPAEIAVASNTSFTPTFISDDVLTNCPTACAGSRACCFDNQVGGAEFAAAFVSARATLDSSNEGAIAFNANFPPVFVNSTDVVVLGGANATANASASTRRQTASSGSIAFYAAEDGDRVVSLDCSICSLSTVTCMLTGINTTRATLDITGPSFSTAGSFNCSAVDSNGGVARAVTTIVTADTLGVPDYTPPETQPVNVAAPPTTVGASDTTTAPGGTTTEAPTIESSASSAALALTVVLAMMAALLI